MSITLEEVDPQDPWFHAREVGRDYITPEDIGMAQEEGGCGEAFFRIVLEAIGRKRAEDPSACAFVATNPEKRRKR